MFFFFLTGVRSSPTFFPDARQAVKELVRDITNLHWARLKRVMRYFGEQPCATCHSDWGGCVKTRRSTTGIVLRYGGSTMATMSGSVSLVSAEAENYAMVSAWAGRYKCNKFRTTTTSRVPLSRDRLVGSESKRRTSWMRKTETQQHEILILAGVHQNRHVRARRLVSIEYSQVVALQVGSAFVDLVFSVVPSRFFLFFKRCKCDCSSTISVCTCA